MEMADVASVERGEIICFSVSVSTGTNAVAKNRIGFKMTNGTSPILDTLRSLRT